MVKLTQAHCVPKPFDNESHRKKKVLHISELSQIAIRYNWRYLRSKSAIVYDGGKLNVGGVWLIGD